MKKLLLTAALMGSMTAMAGNAGDTLVIENANKVKIETRDTVQRIVISGAKDDPDFHYVQRISIPDTSAVRRSVTSVKDFNVIKIHGKDGKPSKWETSIHFNLGYATMLGAPDEYKFKFWPSLEFGFTWLGDWRPYGRQNVWSVGLGINFSHIYMEKDKYWTKVNDVMMLAPYGNDQTDTQTSLYNFSLGIPLMYTHYFGKRQKWGVTLGAIVNFNTVAHTTREYTFAGEDYDVHTKKIGQRPVTIDGIAMLRIPSFPNVYCKYSPMKYFKDGRGPEMNRFSIGFYW